MKSEEEIKQDIKDYIDYNISLFLNKKIKFFETSLIPYDELSKHLSAFGLEVDSNTFDTNGWEIDFWVD